MTFSGEPMNAEVAAWRDLGMMVPTSNGSVFVVDLAPEPRMKRPRDPVVVLHGFPTSSFDWRHVLDALGRGARRVVLFDFLGFGLSDKPDRRYGIDLHGDTTVEVLRTLGIERCVLVSHDMGDTVAGEVLARTMDPGSIPSDPAWLSPVGTVVMSGSGGPPDHLDVDVGARVVVNGSIYLDLAKLTPGQQRLWEAPDERLAAALGALIGGDGLASGISQVFHPDHQPNAAEIGALVSSIEYRDGHLLLPRLIRYLDDRRRAEARYTGAIEAHPSPLTILWAADDPVAVAAMGDRLAARRPDATLVRLEGLGHYPMIEDPSRFGQALAEAIATP